jgi:hypothetical protein
MLLFFVIGMSKAQTPIQEFNFNNSLTNQTGTAALNALNNSPLYTSDRFGNTASAYNLNGTRVLSGNLTNLPVGNATRSISFWVKYNITAALFYPFGYGTQAPNQAFGIAQYTSVDGQPTFNNAVEVQGFGPAQNNIKVTANAIETGVWYHYVITSNGTQTKFYRNNVLLGTENKTWDTVGTNITIGKVINGSYDDSQRLNGSIDDLRIYDVELTQAQVNTLFSPVSIPLVSNVFAANNYSNFATIYYKVDANGGETSTSIKYGFSASFLNNTVIGPITIVNSASLSQELTGLAPSTTYYYQVEVSNSAGTNSSAIQNFTTNTTGSTLPLPTYHFAFDGNFNETNTNTPLTINGTDSNNGEGYVAFVSNGESPNTAAQLNNRSLRAILPNLPQGNYSRSVSFRIKYNEPTIQGQFVFGWGSVATNTGFLHIQNSNNISTMGFGNNAVNNIPLSVTPQVWTNFLIVYEYVQDANSMQATYYKDGLEVFNELTTVGNVNTQSGTFVIGEQWVDGGILANFDLDDIKIFNSALSQSQASQLVLLSNNNFKNNLKFSMFPNPANTILNIEMENELSAVEIYSLQGQKMLVANQSEINVSKLATGMYMVKVTAIDGVIATQKLIIK